MQYILARFESLSPLTLGALACIALTTVIFHIAFNEKTLEYGPTILTTTGIFATFLGIAVGLADFDVNDIQSSVPSLLNGLKTAFWASVAGVGGALTLKYRLYFLGLKAESGARSEGVGVEDIVAELNAIRWGLVGEEDGTLVSQVKLLRQDSNDRLDALKKAQVESLQMLSQMGSKALIEALRDVINDFNARINEQFGENFKHLNEGVAKLLIWQEQHKAHVEVMAERLNEIVEGAKTSATMSGQMIEQASGFTKVANDLAALISSLQTQKEQILSYATGLSSLLKSSETTIPKLESHIVELSQQLANGVSRSQEAFSKAIEEASAATLRSLDSAGKGTSKALEEHGKQLTQLAAKSAEQIDVLDRALAEQLTKSMEALGGQLAALSEKFVDDYTPLTDRLRSLILMAEAK